MATEDNRVKLVLYISPTVNEAVRQMAENESRSISNAGELLLKRAIEAGKLKEGRAA